MPTSSSAYRGKSIVNTPRCGLVLRSPLVGSDRDCSRLTGNPEEILLAEKRAFRSSGEILTG
jgi:hypothetical protein